MKRTLLLLLVLVMIPFGALGEDAADMDQELRKDQMTEVGAVGIRPVFLVEQGIEEAEDDLVGILLRNDEMLILKVLAESAQGLGQEDREGGDELGIQPEDDALDIPGRVFELRPVDFPGADENQGSRIEGVLVILHMIDIAAGEKTVKLEKVMTVRLDVIGGGVTVMIDFNIVTAHVLENVEGGDVSAVRLEHLPVVQVMLDIFSAMMQVILYMV